MATAPKPNENAILTYIGWADPKSGNLLSAQKEGATAAITNFNPSSWDKSFPDGLAFAPKNVEVPQIKLTPQEDVETLSFKGVWSGLDISGYTYQWLADDVNIAGATDATYTPVSGDVGKTLKVKVTSTNATGSTTATSDGIVVLAGLPSNTVSPAITGTAQVGETLTVSDGTWTGTNITYSYRWFVGGNEVQGETANTFVPDVSDHGLTVYAEVTATTTGGSVTADAAATGPVIHASPSNDTIPSITGTAQVGETLTGNIGSWSGEEITYTYQWLADDVNIAGATETTYVLTETEETKQISFRVTATNEGGSSYRTSAKTSAVIAA